MKGSVLICMATVVRWICSSSGDGCRGCHLAAKQVRWRLRGWQKLKYVGDGFVGSSTSSVEGFRVDPSKGGMEVSMGASLVF